MKKHFHNLFLVETVKYGEDFLQREGENEYCGK